MFLIKKYEDTAALTRWASNWKNVFDKESGFFRGKNRNGSWVTPFDPMESNTGNHFPYTEGNAWQHSFSVWHDIEGLRQSYSSEDGLENKLDSLFTLPTVQTPNTPPDVTGLIGQYAHGNEPSHHIAYLYTYLQKPWKTADRVREIMDKFYNNTPDGIVGNEDCGQMSAWYIFSAIGFYPVNPMGGEYVFGSPIVDQAILLLPSGSTFRINVLNNSVENKYIQSITLNAKPYTKSFITHHDMMVGGILEMKMGNKPNPKFGVLQEDGPTSMYFDANPIIPSTDKKKK